MGSYGSLICINFFVLDFETSAAMILCLTIKIVEMIHVLQRDTEKTQSIGHAECGLMKGKTIVSQGLPFETTISRQACL